MERTYSEDEMKVLLFLAKNYLKSEFRFMAPNECHRKMVAVAQQIGVEPSTVEGVIVPLLKESFEEMIAFYSLGGEVKKDSPQKPSILGPAFRQP